jgi:hypothetical protein
MKTPEQKLSDEMATHIADLTELNEILRGLIASQNELIRVYRVINKCQSDTIDAIIDITVGVEVNHNVEGLE